MLSSCLQLLKDQDSPYPYISEADQHALSVYIAGRFGPMLADDATWTNKVTAEYLEPFHATAKRVLAEHPRVSAAETAAAAQQIESLLKKREVSAPNPLAEAMMAAATITSVASLPLGLLSALIVPGGFLLRAVGIAVVTPDGHEPSRLRSLWRAIVAWLPFIAFATMVLGFLWLPATLNVRITVMDDQRFAVIAMVLGAVGVTWAVVSPARGLQDWLAGTRLVPR